jgi:hypothetical protein
MKIVAGWTLCCRIRAFIHVHYKYMPGTVQRDAGIEPKGTGSTVQLYWSYSCDPPDVLVTVLFGASIRLS